MRELFVLSLTISIGIGVLARPASASDAVIGYVNLQRAVFETEEGKRAQARLKKTFEKKQAALTKQENALVEEQKKLQGLGKSVTDEKKAALQQKARELQQDFLKQQQELQDLQKKELESIFKKMRAIIAVIGKTNEYTLILEINDNRLLYGKAHLDLTNEVIRKYNQKYK